MVKKYTYKKLTWVDLFKPTQEEVRQIMDEYEIHPNVANELITPNFKPKVDLHKNFIYLILHFPAIKHSNEGEVNQEVDFIIGKDFIITSRYDTIDAIHKFSKVFEVSSTLEKGIVNENAGELFFLILSKLYASVFHELEYIEDSLEKTESKIFQGEEKMMVQELSNIGRDLLNLKQATNSHREVLESLQELGGEFYDEEFAHQMDVVIKEFGRLRHGIEINRESLNELRDTNDSLLSTKQNETMMVLTIMAFVTFPLSLLASIFGMNTSHMPLVGQQNDFWMVIGIMSLLTILFFLFFKYKKWL